MKKNQRIDSMLRDIEMLLQGHELKKFRVPKPTDSENDVYVIEEPCKRTKSNG